MKTSFSEHLEALAPFPVPQALPRALELTWRWSLPLQMCVGVDVALEPPPPLDQRHDGRRQRTLQPVPPTDELNADLSTSTSSARPRDRTWKAERTWKGIGRHGKGMGVALRLETVDKEETVGVDPGASHEMLEAADELLGDVGDDQGLEGLQLRDPRRRQRRRRPA